MSKKGAHVEDWDINAETPCKCREWTFFRVPDPFMPKDCIPDKEYDYIEITEGTCKVSVPRSTLKRIIKEL